MLNHGSLTFSSSSSHVFPASLCASSSSISCCERPWTNAESIPVSIASRASRLSSASGLEEEHVDPRDHLCDVLVRDVGQRVLAEVDERRIGPVPEEEELAVVLPHQLAVAVELPVRLQHLDVARVAVVLEHDLLGLVLGQIRDSRPETSAISVSIFFFHLP